MLGVSNLNAVSFPYFKRSPDVDYLAYVGGRVRCPTLYRFNENFLALDEAPVLSEEEMGYGLNGR